MSATATTDVDVQSIRAELKHLPTWPGIAKVATAFLGLVLLVAGGTLGGSKAIAEDAGAVAEEKADAAVVLSHEALKAHREHEAFMKTEFQQFRASVESSMEQQRQVLNEQKQLLEKIEARQRNDGGRVVNASGRGP